MSATCTGDVLSRVSCTICHLWCVQILHGSSTMCLHAPEHRSVLLCSDYLAVLGDAHVLLFCIQVYAAASGRGPNVPRPSRSCNAIRHIPDLDSFNIVYCPEQWLPAKRCTKYRYTQHLTATHKYDTGQITPAALKIYLLSLQSAFLLPRQQLRQR